MSQRECAGFNWPELAIPAEEPVSISPEAVSRAGCVSYIASFTEADRSIVIFDPSGIFPVIVTPGRNPFPPEPSDAAGLGHPASHTTRPSKAFSGTFTSGFPPSFQSLVVVVGQPANCAEVRKSIPPSPCKPGPFVSLVRGLGHPIKPVSDVRRTDARRRKRDRPDAVTHGFQVS